MRSQLASGLEVTPACCAFTLVLGMIGLSVIDQDVEGFEVMIDGATTVEGLR